MFQVFAAMTSAREEELGRIIRRYVSDPASTQQLRRLPAFAVPKDAHDVFTRLLERLDEVASAEQRVSSLRLNEINQQDPC
jgi:hypothetical protein